MRDPLPVPGICANRGRAGVPPGLRLLERKVAYPAQKKHGNIPL